MPDNPYVMGIVMTEATHPIKQTIAIYNSHNKKLKKPRLSIKNVLYNEIQVRTMKRNKGATIADFVLFAQFLHCGISTLASIYEMSFPDTDFMRYMVECIVSLESHVSQPQLAHIAVLMF